MAGLGMFMLFYLGVGFIGWCGKLQPFAVGFFSSLELIS